MILGLYNGLFTVYLDYSYSNPLQVPYYIVILVIDNVIYSNSKDYSGDAQWLY